MECKEVEELLSEYIENELSQEVHDDICRHLEKCLPCQMLAEQIEALMCSCDDLEEEVPFFLTNRLYYIPELEDSVIELESSRYYLQWVAAVIGTILMFLNLFYFTNIYPPANRALHDVTSDLKVIAVKTQGILEKMNESKDEAFTSNEEETEEQAPNEDADQNGVP